MNSTITTGYYIKLASVLMASLLASAALPAAADAPSVADGTKRPKVCLVLSGGGARGAAHVGVLKVLEEYRVPIDCIAGTSMGSLVGAAYASGTSVVDMEKLIGGLTTNLLFQDAPPRQKLQMRRKQEDQSLLFTPEIGVNSIGGDMLPKGLVSGVQLETVLRPLAAPGYRNFDELPIPYRAVATNLVTGKAVVFNKGVLSKVMRASMSVPVAIDPVEVETALLVDGMLVNNLPVDVGRAMGGDVIIAVNVGTPLLKRDELSSILGVAGQMLSILTEQNVQNSLALLRPTDILISPELGDFKTSDFDHLSETLAIGEAATRKVAAQLSKLSLSPEQYAIYRKGLVAMVAQDLRPVDEIRFTNTKLTNPEYLKSLMQTKPGQEIKQEILDQDVRRVYGTDDFSHVDYHIVEEHGQRTLVMDAVEKSWGPNYFRGGLGLETDFQGDSSFTLLGRLRKTWVNSLGAEWTTEAQIGKADRIASEFYQPIDSQHHYFVAPTIELSQSLTNLYSGNQSIARYDFKRYRVGLDLGRDLEEFGRLRIGVKLGELYPTLSIGPSKLAPEAKNIVEGAFTASLVLDKLDSVKFPTAGWSANASLYNSNASLGATNNYTKWDARGSYVHTFGKHTFTLSGLANGSLEGTLPNYDQNVWGGLLRMSGLRTGQMIGESLTYGRLMYYNKLIDYQLFDGLYAGFSLETGKMRNPLVLGNSSDLINAASIFMATDSPIGPLYIGYGHASTGSSSFYLYLGLPY